MLTLADRVAAFGWDFAALHSLHSRLARAVKPELDVLWGLDRPALDAA